MEEARTDNTAWTPPTLSPRAKTAIKVATSLTLAFILPMALGWSQPQTAAITVMIIAAAGDTRQSLLAGTLRLAGTLAGAVIGLTLVALFAQERMLYLLSASLVVSACLYLYSAYRGDGTVFMLTAVVTLLVFNGGNTEDAFLYGVNRAFMTAFGVAIYTLVCSFLWPDRAEHRLEEDALQLVKQGLVLFRQLDGTKSDADTAQQLAAMEEARQALSDSWSTALRQLDGVASYRKEWQTLLSTQASLATDLAAAIEPENRQALAYGDYIHDYDRIIEGIEGRFHSLAQLWQGQTAFEAEPVHEIQWRAETVAELSHLQRARIAARVEALQKIEALLVRTERLGRCVVTEDTPLDLDVPSTRSSQFYWRDPESLKLGIRVLLTFWLSSAIWILFNPPGGFIFVTMTCLLLPLVSFTPLSPKMLYLLFSLGFVVALPCYVFLLPSLSTGYQLALFLFVYVFLGQYLFQGPVAIFFLLGLFTLGIGNTMHYNMGVLLNVMFMFYLVITMIIFSCVFIFNSKPEYLFNLMRRRFLNQIATLAGMQQNTNHESHQRLFNQHSQYAQSSLEKMQLWASKVDTRYFATEDKRSLLDFSKACQSIAIRTQALLEARDPAKQAVLKTRLGQFGSSSNLQQVLSLLASEPITEKNYGRIDSLAPTVESVEQGLDQALAAANIDSLGAEDIAYFYSQLNRQALLWQSVGQCKQAMSKINWQTLVHSRF